MREGAYRCSNRRYSSSGTITKGGNNPAAEAEGKAEVNRRSKCASCVSSTFQYDDAEEGGGGGHRVEEGAASDAGKDTCVLLVFSILRDIGMYTEDEEEEEEACERKVGSGRVRKGRGATLRSEGVVGAWNTTSPSVPCEGGMFVRVVVVVVIVVVPPGISLAASSSVVSATFSVTGEIGGERKSSCT